MTLKAAGVPGSSLNSVCRRLGNRGESAGSPLRLAPIQGIHKAKHRPSRQHGYVLACILAIHKQNQSLAPLKNIEFIKTTGIILSGSLNP
jgi:hypothetical protein